jgi:hypothetical protein
MLSALALVIGGALLLGGGPTLAQEAIKQIELTAKQIEGFIAAQKDMAAVTEKLPEPKADQPPDPKVKAALEGVAKRHGFKDFDEYDDVASNIAMVMSGFDPDTKTFVTPQEILKRQIDEISADKTIPRAEKAKILDELNENLKMAQPVQYPGNIKLIEKYLDQLDDILK